MLISYLSKETPMKKLMLPLLALLLVSCAISDNLSDLVAAFGNQSQTFSSDFEGPGLFDAYSDPEGLVESEFRNGGLELTIHEEEVYFWIYPDVVTPKNISVQVDVIYVQGDPETGAGIICNYNYENDYGIYFEITFDGYYVIFKETEAGWETIEDFTFTDLVNSSGANRIKAVCDNGSYDFYINDVIVSSFTETTTLGDEIALYGYTYFTPESVIRFDNFYAEGLE